MALVRVVEHYMSNHNDVWNYEIAIPKQLNYLLRTTYFQGVDVTKICTSGDTQQQIMLQLCYTKPTQNLTIKQIILNLLNYTHYEKKFGQGGDKAYIYFAYFLTWSIT